MYAYYTGLQNFLIEYKTSETIPYAKRLLADYESKNGTPTQSIPNSFEDNPSTVYYIISIYQRDSIFDKSNIDVFNFEFLNNYYRLKEMETKRLELNKDYFVFTFKEFNKETAALQCVEKMKTFATFKELEANYLYYIISKKNYQLLISSENTYGYTKFYATTYPK